MPNEERVLDEDSNLKPSNLDKKKQRDTKESDIEISSVLISSLSYVRNRSKNIFLSYSVIN